MPEKVERSPSMVRLVYFLHLYARDGSDGKQLPPEEFGNLNWTEVYKQFHALLGDGRPFQTFKHSAEGLRRGNISGHIDFGITLLPKYDSILRMWALKSRNEQWRDLQNYRKI